MKSIVIPLILTLLAGASTGVGSLIVFFVRVPKKSYLQFLLGLSVGVLIYVSFVELLAGAVRDIGFFVANVAFFFGIVFIVLIDYAIPHEYIAEKVEKKSKDKSKMKLQ